MTNLRRRWAARLLTVALAAAGVGTTGCKQQLFGEPGDFRELVEKGLPARLELEPHTPIAPSAVPEGLRPPTAIDPTRPGRPITLKECIALAVEQGNLGQQGGPQNAGFANNQQLVQFGGRAVGGTDQIRALVFDPAIAAADIERSLSKFDARWINSLTWNKQDQALLSEFQASFQNGDQATLSSTLAKPLPTGGVAGITFSTQYTNLSNPPSGANNFSALPTSYSPRVQFLFEQPLLQGFGIEINQLLQAHPGSQLLNLRPSGGQTTEGILITRIRYDQQRAEFDRQVNLMLLNVEFAYWNLFAAYYSLYAQEEILRQSYDLLSVLQKRLDAGTISKQDLTQSRAQYWQFRAAVLSARQQVLEAEQNLRGLMGMSTATAPDRLVPVDEPNLAPFEPDFYQVATDALSYRPELILARQDLKFRQLDLQLSKNLRRPDLRFFATYDIQGIGTRLDGAPTEQVTGGTGLPQTVPQNALDSLMDNKFNSWQLGLRLDMPLGFRDANAATRQGHMNLIRSYWQLHDAERKAMEAVLQQWRLLPFRNGQIELIRAQRLDLQTTLELYKQLIEGGTWNVNTLFNILQVQQNTALAISNEFQNVAQYNQAISGLEYAKGTIQKYNNVSIGEGALPEHVSKKAADHFRSREVGLKLRQHPAATGWGERTDEVYKSLNAGDRPSATLKPGELPTLPTLPDPKGGGEKLPSPKPLPAGEKEKVSYVPGEPAPTTIRPFPTEPVGVVPTAPVTVPTVGTATEAAPRFQATDTVKIPARIGGGTPVEK